MNGNVASRSEFAPAKNGFFAVDQSSIGRANGDEAGESVHDGDDDAGERAAGDVTGSEQDAGALVAFGGQFDLGQILVPEFYSQIAIDQPAHDSADKNRAGRRERQINSNRKRERRNAAHLEHDRDHDAEEDERPRKFAAENSFDDVGHQRRFRRVEFRHGRSVGTQLVRAVDSRIDQVDGCPRHSRGNVGPASGGIEPLPNTICVLV